jgi:pyruvate carboxylase
MDALSGNTSQPARHDRRALRARTATRPRHRRDPRNLGLLGGRARPLRGLRIGLQAPASEVYLHEMPGGQFTNLKAQARSMGLEERWHEVARRCMPM